jgi:hypothetical protein
MLNLFQHPSKIYSAQTRRDGFQLEFATLHNGAGMTVTEHQLEKTNAQI